MLITPYPPPRQLSSLNTAPCPRGTRCPNTPPYLAKQGALLRGAPRSRGSRLRVDDDVVGHDSASLQKGNEGELRRCGVASGVGHQPCVAHLVPGHLCKAVYRLCLQLRSLVLAAVPLVTSKR